MDGRIHIKFEKWFIPVIEEYPALEKRYRMLEPEKDHHIEGRERILAGIRSDWLGILNTFRTKYYYNIIELSSQISSLKSSLEVAS